MIEKIAFISIAIVYAPIALFVIIMVSLLITGWIMEFINKVLK